MKVLHPPEMETIASQAYSTDIILLDIIEYSLLSNEKQYLAIFYLNKIIRNITNLLALHSDTQESKFIEGLVPTGDGCYVILNPSITGYGPLFALFLRNFLLFNNTVLDNLFNGVRISVHHGSIIPIHFLETENFVGDGLNICSRLLNHTVTDRAHRFYDDENIVVISEQAWQRFNELFPRDKKAVNDYLKKINFNYTRAYTVKDKHKHQPRHIFRFIDSAKLIGSAPPRPKSLVSE